VCATAGPLFIYITGPGDCFTRVTLVLARYMLSPVSVRPSNRPSQTEVLSKRLNSSSPNQCLTIA